MENKKKIGLTTKIFIALIAGAIAGLLLNYVVPAGFVRDRLLINGILYVVGQGFIRLMQMLVVPLVFCSLVCGSMSIGDTKKLGSVGVRTLVFYLITTALAISVALTVGNLINPGIGLNMGAIKAAENISAAEATSVADTILNIIPKNIFTALSDGTMLQIIFFALVLGIILAKIGDRIEVVKNFFAQFNDIMMEMTMLVMSFAPFGVFCLIAKTFAGIGFDAFVPLLKYMAGVMIALYILIYPIIYSMLHRIHDFIKRSGWCQSNSFYQEILPGYGVCIFNSNIQCNHSIID